LSGGKKVIAIGIGQGMFGCSKKHKRENHTTNGMLHFKPPILLTRHFREMQLCLIGGKVHPEKAERNSGPVLFAKVVECGTAK